MNLHLSKCHIFGNHMLWLNYDVFYSVCNHNAVEHKSYQRLPFTAYVLYQASMIKKMDCKIVTVFLSISLNICFGCSKDLSH